MVWLSTSSALLRLAFVVDRLLDYLPVRLKFIVFGRAKFGIDFLDGEAGSSSG